MDTKTSKTEKRTTARLEFLVNAYNTTAFSADKEETKEDDDDDDDKKLTLVVNKMVTPSPWTQFTVLYRRASKNIVRDKMGFLSKLFYSTFLGLIFGGVCYDVLYNLNWMKCFPFHLKSCQ